MKTQQQTIFIWDRGVYYSTAKGWARTAIERVEDAAAIVQEHCKRDSKILLLYDPETLQTEYSECPGGGRAIVREVLAGSHESLNNPHTAWGFQSPWQISASAGGNHGTFCSFETIPTLYLLSQTLYDLRYPISRCFPIATLAMFSGATPGHTNVFLVVDKEGQAFVYLNTATGLRAARKVSAGKREDFDVWSEISLIFGEYGVTFEDGGMRPVVRIYQAPGTDAKTQCPYWETLAAFGQVEVHNFSVLATLFAGIPPRHTSSLIEDLPKNINLDFGLKFGAAVLATVLLGGGIYAYNDLSKASREIRVLEGQQSSLTTQKTSLERNKREIEELHKLYANDRFDYSHGHLQLLQALSGAIPRDATLLNISVGTEAPSKFKLNGIFWNQKVAASRQGGSTTVNNLSPVTSITRHLESTIQGLLVAPSPNAFNSQTGDFVLEGNTPRPEGAAAATPPPAGRPVAGRPPATSGRR
jgi:hypothetical protein